MKVLKKITQLLAPLQEASSNVSIKTKQIKQ